MSLDHLRVEGNELRKYGCEAANLLALVRWRCRLRTDGYVASYADILDDIGLKRTAARAARDLLVEAGAIAIGTVPGTRSQRWFIPDHLQEPDFTHRQEPDDHLQETAHHLQETDFEPSIREDLEEVEDLPPAPDELPLQLPILVMVKPSEPDPFDAFWSHYPHKTGKDAARKAMAKALTRTSIEDIATGLMSQLDGLRQQKSRGFCPHPATWLNQGRWQDEPADVAPTQTTRNGLVSYSQLIDQLNNDPAEQNRSLR